MKFGKRIAIFLLACLAFVLAIVAAFFLFPEETIPHVILSEIPQFEGVPKNEYDKDLFQEENGFLRYDGENSLFGVDVSSHQGEIDWHAVKDAGVEFAIIRAAYRGYTNGGLSADERFQENLQSAKEAGLLVGAYVFSQAVTVEEAADEANMLLALLDGASLDLPVFYDWEYVESDVARTKDISGKQITDFAKTFCEEVEQAGYSAGVYFNKSMGYAALNLSELKNYEFWLAEYATVPAFYFRFETWQHTDNGMVPGIREKVDLNIRFTTNKESHEVLK